MRFRKHVFLFVIVPFVLISAGYSYYRFMVAHDYIVGYEGDCDPAVQKCFVGCNDTNQDIGTCTDTYDYAKMKKYAVDLYAECGKDITDCKDASVCLSQDRDCSITYCDSSNSEDTCSTEASSTAAIPSTP